MKSKILFYIFIITFFFSSPINSQISIGPEVGISYLPFTLYGSNSVNKSNRINLLFGISAQVIIHEKWDAKVRISYTNRTDVKWTEVAEFPPIYFDNEWKHQDLNIDLSLHYKLYKSVSVGIGPSLIRSFMESNIVQRNEGEIFHGKVNKSFFAINSSISLEIKKVNINLMYIRMNKFNGKKSSRVPIGNNRIDLSLSYRFGKI